MSTNSSGAGQGLLLPNCWSPTQCSWDLWFLPRLRDVDASFPFVGKVNMCPRCTGHTQDVDMDMDMASYADRSLLSTAPLYRTDFRDKHRALSPPPIGLAETEGHLCGHTYVTFWAHQQVPLVPFDTPAGTPYPLTLWVPNVPAGLAQCWLQKVICTHTLVVQAPHTHPSSQILHSRDINALTQGILCAGESSLEFAVKWQMLTWFGCDTDTYMLPQEAPGTQAVNWGPVLSASTEPLTVLTHTSPTVAGTQSLQHSPTWDREWDHAESQLKKGVRTQDRCRAPSNKHDDQPHFTCNQPLLNPFLSVRHFAPPCSPFPYTFHQ